jgi:hypothetical protein
MRTTLLASVLLLLLSGAPVRAEDPAPTASAAAAPAAAAPEIDPLVQSRMRAALERLVAAKQLEFSADVAHDAIQKDGQRIEFGASRTYSVRRPDRVLVEAVTRDGHERGALFDGAQVVVWDATEGVYAAAPFTGTIDAAIDYLRDQLDVPLPLSGLLRSDIGSRLTGAARSARFVAAETIEDALCDHFAIRGDDVDAQVWIAQGKEPVVCRLVLTYREEPGEPQFEADFYDWDFDADFDDDLFTFRPPKHAQRIPFAPRTAAAGTGSGGAAPQGGSQR